MDRDQISDLGRAVRSLVGLADDATERWFQLELLVGRTQAFDDTVADLSRIRDAAEIVDALWPEHPPFGFGLVGHLTPRR